MDKQELLIAIPTKNHPKYIMYYLSKILDDALRLNIDILILDASDDDATEKTVEGRTRGGYRNLYYKRYPRTATLEERLIDVYVGTGYKYVWLCGDGVVVNLRKDISIVENEIQKGRQIIVFGQYKINDKEYVEYTSSIDFCLDCFSQNTYFGSVILEADLVTKELFVYCQKKYLEHAVPALYYELFRDGNIRAVYIYQSLFFDANPYKKNSIAMKEGRTIYAFAHLFYETIQKLPDCYNIIKKELYRWQKAMYDWGHLWAMRANGNLNLRIYWRERKYLRLSSDKKGIVYLLIVLCPHKLAKAIALIEDRIW
ncbi:MAG: hypothetical protein K2K90_17940 [Lachnospiraceae bacterium]|nr:hypothetical protein [Lachnospiraceae bacterium]